MVRGRPAVGGGRRPVREGPSTWLGLVAFASGVALSTLAWTAQGAMDEGLIGWAHLVADILHLIPPVSGSVRYLA